MERRNPKSPAVVDSKHLGCMFGFSAIFDFHHSRPRQKLLHSDSHGNKTLTGEDQTRSKAENIDSIDENQQRINKKHKKARNDAQIIVDQNHSPEMSSELSSHDKGFCNQIPLKHAKPYSTSRTKHYRPEKNSLQIVPTFKDQTEVGKHKMEKSLWERVMKSRHVYPSEGKRNLDPSKSLEISKPKQNFEKEKASISSSGTNRENKDIRPMDLKLSIRPEKSANRHPKRRESEIFIEARKHLSERFRKVEMFEALSGKQTPRTLEGILLSSPKHEFMDTLSSKWEKCDGSVSTQMRFSPYGNSQLAYERSLPTQKGKFKLDDLLMICDSSSKGNEKISETPQKQSNNNKIKISKEYIYSERLRLESSFESQMSRFSPDLSSSSSENICKLQITSRDRDREENPSPISILEPFFMDDVGSPTSTITESGEPPMRPLHLDFDEHPEISLSTETMDKEIISDYIKNVYQTSQLNWDEFLEKGCPSESSCDQKLLYDCVKEVLVDLHQWYFSSFLKYGIQTVPMEDNVVNIVMKKVEWSTVSSTTSHTLHTLYQLMKKDIAESGKWVDVRADSDYIVTEIVEEALEYEILEMILNIETNFQTIRSAHIKGLMLEL